MDFSQQLRLLRVHLRCTQKDLATKLNMSPGSIHKYENNQMQPTLRTLSKFERFIVDNEIVLDNIGTETNRRGLMERQEIPQFKTNDQQLIELQQEKIATLQAQIKSQDYNKPVLDLLTDYQFSMEVDFKFKFPKMSVDLRYREPCADFTYICNKLGYSEETLRNDIFSFGKMMPFTNHTIHTLRSANDKEKILSKAVGIIKSFSFAKEDMATYNVKLPMIYRHKDGRKVYVLNQYLINWYDKTAVANIHFMNGEAE